MVNNLSVVRSSLGLDISNWSNPADKPLLPRHVACWKADGRTWVCAGTQRESVTRQQLTVVRDGGLVLKAYTYLYFQDDPAGQVREGLRRVQGFPICEYWVDLEDSPGGLGPVEVEHWIDCALSTADALAPCRVIAYTGYWWLDLVGLLNSRALAGRLVCMADYDGRPTLAGMAPAAGGIIVAKQYAGTTDLCGVGADLDYEEEPQMSGAGVRFNAQAAWFKGRRLEPGPYGADKDATWQLRSDFGLPAQAAAVEIEVFLAPAGGDSGDAAILLFDGGSPDGSMTGYAGQVSLHEGGHGTITVYLDAQGRCRARYPVPVETLVVGCLRWWPAG
jgi:hypothetical protein